MNTDPYLPGPPRDPHPAHVNGASQELARVICLEPLDGGSETSAGGLLEVWQLVVDRKRAVLLIALAAVACALLITFLEQPVYQARTTIEVQSAGESSLEPVAEAPEAGYTPETYLQTQAKILQSATLRARVLAKVKEQQKTPYHPDDRLAALRRWLHLPARKNAAEAVAPVKLEVKPFENTRIIEILCDSPDPNTAALFANTMTDQFAEYRLEARWNAAQKATRWLTLQLDKLRRKLQDSENQLQAYSRATGLVFTSDKGEDRQNVEQEKLAQLQAELSRAQADRVMKQSAYEIARSSPPDTVPQVLDNGRLGTYQGQLADLRRQLAEMSPDMTPANYRMVRVQAQIRALESTFRKERDNIMARIRNEYEAAARREAVLSQAFDKQSRVVSEQAAKTVNYDILRRETESTRKLYDELLEKMHGAGLAAAMRASNIRVVDPAEVPKQPYRPNIYQNVAVGLLAGLLLGVAFVVAGDHINRSLKAPGETPYHLKVPELGIIPEQHAVAESPRDGNARLRPLGTGLNGDGGHVELVTWQDRPSVLAESFRSTLASILVSEQNGRRPRVILVTSAGRGEGKSSTVSNLGIALAEINQKVLLLDADMRKPHLHHIFNAPNTWGLSDLLRERTSLKDMPLEALARETEINGLYILPSGTGTVSIANLLYSNRTSELLERLRQEFDMVLIDTPPMLYISDARVLGRLADGAILVVRAGRTTRDAAMGAKQRLVDDRIPVLGTILNGWDPKAKTRYGYYAYPAGAGESA